MKSLYAGPWVGEFGWELFCWQGHLRHKSKGFDQCFVACKRGHEVLYKDFAQTFPLEVSCEEADMWDCKGYQPPKFEQIFKRSLNKNDVYYPSKKAVLRYDHTHRLDNEPIFARFKEQEFVLYGERRKSDYEIIIHARNKQNKVNAGMNSNYRNWSKDKWKQLVKSIGPDKVACIGTKKGSLYVGGKDLRGISLKKLCDILANAKVIVGPSSGPIHLASLCKCPQITWYGSPYKNNEIRYMCDWNPFKVNVEVFEDEQWDIPINLVQKSLKCYMD